MQKGDMRYSRTYYSLARYRNLDLAICDPSGLTYSIEIKGSSPLIEEFHHGTCINARAAGILTIEGDVYSSLGYKISPEFRKETYEKVVEGSFQALLDIHEKSKSCMEDFINDFSSYYKVAYDGMYNTVFSRYIDTKERFIRCIEHFEPPFEMPRSEMRMGKLTYLTTTVTSYYKPEDALKELSSLPRIEGFPYHYLEGKFRKMWPIPRVDLHYRVFVAWYLLRTLLTGDVRRDIVSRLVLALIFTLFEQFPIIRVDQKKRFTCTWWESEVFYQDFLRKIKKDCDIGNFYKDTWLPPIVTETSFGGLEERVREMLDLSILLLKEHGTRFRYLSECKECRKVSGLLAVMPWNKITEKLVNATKNFEDWIKKETLIFADALSSSLP
jgi:hypothetical protein